MSSCGESNIQQNYIVINTNEFDTLSACTGIWTSNIYGCDSPITVHNQLNLLQVSNNNFLDRILVIDNVTGLVQYRNISSIITGGTEIIDFSYDDKNTFIIDRFDGVSFSATINTVTGFTITGNLTTSGDTFIGGDITPINDNISNLGNPLKRFRDINTVSGTSTVWESTIKVITPELDLGLDISGNSRVITANNIVIDNDVLFGGSY